MTSSNFFQHFVCAKCEKPFLGHRHYERKGLAYCETHYNQVFIVLIGYYRYLDEFELNILATRKSLGKCTLDYRDFFLTYLGNNFRLTERFWNKNFFKRFWNFKKRVWKNICTFSSFTCVSFCESIHLINFHIFICKCVYLYICTYFFWSIWWYISSSWSFAPKYFNLYFPRLWSSFA